MINERIESATSLPTSEWIERTKDEDFNSLKFVLLILIKRPPSKEILR